VPDVRTPTRDVTAHGISISVPEGWEARITRPPDDGVPGGTRNPVLHASSAALPEVRGDFGGGVVERLGTTDVFIALVEYDQEATATPLFAQVGLPSGISGSQFKTNTLQRGVKGQAGAQWFLQIGGRAFCLYVVLGAHADRWRLATVASQVVQSIKVASAQGR
jgi:hypothetical protein